LTRLRWLDQHRTAAGSLPEKVLRDGQPASVSPLAWTAAAVVITADRLSS
jgi:GH15 family glucan-1,4-alpha-glucosidase